MEILRTAKLLNSLFYIFYIFLLFSSCKSDEDNINREDPLTKIDSNQPISVKTLPANFGDFNLQLKTKGKVYAKNKIDLHFILNEQIKNIFVQNGSKVNKGQIIAKQDGSKYKNQLIEALEQLERAKIDVEDILIGFNHSLRDSLTVPSDLLDMAQNRSNYNTSLSNLNNVRIDLTSTTLKSPINGVVANLDAKVYSYPDKTKPFCTIVDNSTLEVEFSILEDNYMFLSIGQEIEVSASLSPKLFKGRVIEINPVVDANGMIKIKGEIDNSSGDIIDGMNVNIVLNKKIKDKVFVPKESIVLRNNREVVFTFYEGRAIWNYVETSFENFDSVVILNGINEDDEVIIKNNVNLANNSIVIKETN